MIPNQRKRVLVVDNDDRDRRKLGHLFEFLGHEALATWSGTDALRDLKSQPFDFVFVDQFVADMYVGNFIERVLRLRRHPQVVIMYKPGQFRRVKYNKLLGQCLFLEKGKSDIFAQTAFPAFELIVASGSDVKLADTAWYKTSLRSGVDHGDG